MESKGHYFYVLMCNDGSYYAGYTNDLQKRLKTHNEGKGAKYTRGRLPVSIIYHEEFQTKQEAMKAEYAFKQLDRKKKEKFLMKEVGEAHETTKSFKEKNGSLYLVPTPIGNLEDMSFRAIRILKEADIIAAEDTRNTKKLCNYFEITTPVISYHEHNKETSGHKIIQALKEEKVIALVSDAGMPTIADPGYELVLDAIDQGIPVILCQEPMQP